MNFLTEIEEINWIGNAGVVGLAVAVVAIFLYSTFVKWAWDLWDDASKYKRIRTKPSCDT